MNTIAYHNPAANPPWIATVILNGKPWVYCSGQSEADAQANAEAFAKAEMDRQRCIVGSAAADKIAAPPVNVGTPNARGHHFAGKTWMRDPGGALCRVPNELVDEYINKGYRRSGPRSK